MQIEVAKEILEDLQTDLPQFPPEDRRNAVKLGIEALKHLQDFRHAIYGELGGLLPGETEG